MNKLISSGHQKLVSKDIRPEVRIFLSAFLLALAFPKFNFGWTAWLALVPAFFAIERSKSSLESFAIFFSVGFLFDLISLEWLRHVTLFGLFFVSAILAIYFGIFGVAARYFFKKHPSGLLFWALPSFWVILEWIRTEIPIWAFGWNLMGYSQSSCLPIARFASIFGVYGVSFLIVWMNLVIWFFLKSFENKKEKWAAIRRAIYIALVTAIIFFHFSFPQTNSPAKNQQEISVSVIQGNIPQTEKWDSEFKSSIIDHYEKLSEFAVYNHPDLIIWPEAAWPGVFNLDPEGERILKLIRSAKTSFLIGSPYEEEWVLSGTRPQIFNSAFLMDPNGKIISRYDKIRLVPFGEFVPFAAFFNWFGLERYAYSLGVGDFSHGSQYTVFELPGSSEPVRFSTLICFEDTFPELARKFVKRGAQFFVVITNDAWFGKSAAPYQHLQASIFRAIENAVPVVRSANTGVSAFISAGGEVLNRVKDQRGYDTWITGGLTRPISLRNIPTLYQKFGFLFPVFCLLVSALSILWSACSKAGFPP